MTFPYCPEPPVCFLWVKSNLKKTVQFCFKYVELGQQLPDLTDVNCM